MKTLIKNSRMILIGLALSGFLFSMACIFAQVEPKPKGKPWIAPEAEAKKKNPLKPDDESALKTGKQIWHQQCKSCHGATGKGDGTKAEKIEISCGDFTSDDVQKLSDGALYWKLTEGRKPMPAFKQKLADSERWSAVLFIRTFKSSDVVKK